MPLEDLSENPFPTTFNHIPMTWYNPIEIKFIDLLYTPIKPSPILGARRIPVEPLLPRGRASCAHETHKKFCQ